MNLSLEEDVKSLIMLNINKKLTENEDFSIADKYLTDIMAIGYNNTLESAIDDVYELQKQMEFLIGKISRNDIAKRIYTSETKFKKEISGFKEYFRLKKQNVPDKLILNKVEEILISL